MWSPPLEGLAKGARAARRALELDENLPEGHLALGDVLWIRDWDWKGAEREIRRALELDPGYVFAHQLYSELLVSVDRLEEAVEHQRLSQELDPFWVSTTTKDLGVLYALMGEEEMALDEWRRALAIAPNYYATHRHLGNYFCQKEMFDEAIAALEHARSLSPDDPHLIADLGYCHARSGSTGAARELLQELEARSRQRYVSPMALALLHVGLGEDERAVEWLQRAGDVHALKVVNLRADPRFDALRSDSRVADLLRRIGPTG